MGGAANKNDRKFLGFAPRELVERGRGASVIRQNPADFVRNTFELRSIHTARAYFYVFNSSFFLKSSIMFTGVGLISLSIAK